MKTRERVVAGVVQRLLKRLNRIAAIIEAVDDRCLEADMVTPTLQEMTQAEMSEIYKLAKGTT